MRSFGYLLIGMFFGITMYKSEAASWFRIYEMFRFEAFHMYGIIGTAVVLGIIIIAVIKKFNIIKVATHISARARFVPRSTPVSFPRSR